LYKKTRKEFKGYYVEVPNGMDAIRAYKRIKRNQKKDRFFEELKDRQYFQKPSFKKRETEKRRRQVLWKLQKARDDNQFMGVKRKR
jgi:ribosomal protein S21